MDYLKSVVPSQLIAERGSNLVVINPGSANVRIGFAHQNVPYNIPHCISRYVKSGQQRHVQDQMLNTQATPAQNMEREKAYDMIASFLKVPFLDEEATNNSLPRKVGRVDGFAHHSRHDSPITWTNVLEQKSNSHTSKDGEPSESFVPGDSDSEEYKFKEFFCGEEALGISPSEPYCLSHPIRRGHFNISRDYPLQQVITDLCVIWNWILVDKLHILPVDRSLYSAVLVLPESFDNREIKEMLSIVLRDLGFGTAVVHQEGLATAFGNGLSTACVVNIGAQVTSVICIEDGVALPSTIITMPYGGEDISRCLLWVQRRHHAWPSINTDPVTKPIDMLMLNKIKESYCQIREGEFDAVAIVHSCEEGKPPGSHKARLAALNVPPMGLFHPTLFVPEEYPPPPRSWFHDHEDMLEDTWHMDFARRPDMSDGFYLGTNGTGVSMWDTYQVYPTRLKKYEMVGLAEAITTSILSTDYQCFIGLYITIKLVHHYM
ncbi:actin-related protein 9 isoform X2 [Phalaenopsis equestris]|uniref:actin-related protein 9 isoform X2 n=1 Tax=Phalaenopsis equestris TaxID=78828 RepID=UPI0009E62236|nr:actin-related protein 9 isoform X2 [Phalaenopsis equestris]